MRKNIFFRAALFGLAVFLGACKSSAPPKSAADIRDIFAGAASVFVLLEDNSLWSAGYRPSGRSVESPEPAEAGIVQVQEGNSPFMGAKFAAAGETHTLILKTDGTLWGAGLSLYGELGPGGDGTGNLAVFTKLNIDGAASVAAGNNSTFVIKNDGTLWAAGYNYYGELGLGDRNNRASFTQVSGAGNDVKAVASGVRHTVILKNDGSVWTAGYNFNGQLGLGTRDDVNVFTKVEGVAAAAIGAGNYHTMILKADGSVWTAGENYYGQLGWDDKADRTSFVQVQDEQGRAVLAAKDAAARGDMTLIIKSDGSLLLAGSYADPRPRDETNLPPEPAPQGEAKSSFAPLVPEGDSASSFKGVKKAVLGNQGIYVIAEDGRLWAAGSNRYGQLNLGYDTDFLPALKPVYP